jgi:Uncharacterized conserved protein
MNPEDVVQANLDAYNDRDIDLFMSHFSDDIKMYSYGESEPWLDGPAAVRSRYDQYFIDSPNLLSTIKNRIVFGNKVIDHEYITGVRGSEVPLELILIYEVDKGKIVKTTSIKK